MSILVIGSFMMDQVVSAERAPEAGETIIGSSFANFPGGKGANQAVAAARLGGNVIMAGKLGKDANGAEMRRVIESHGVDARFVSEDERVASGVGFITLESDGQNRIIVVPGANLEFTLEEVERLHETIRQADIVVMQLEMDIRVIERAAELAAGYGVPVILNPAPATALRDELLRNITYLTPNEKELAILAGLEIESIEDVEEGARRLLAKGVQNVVVTLGERGALAMNSNGAILVEGFPVQPIDTVAAGDSFNGAMAVKLVEGISLEEAVRYANAVGAITVTRQGAIPSLPSSEEVQAFIESR